MRVTGREEGVHGRTLSAMSIIRIRPNGAEPKIAPTHGTTNRYLHRKARAMAGNCVDSSKQQLIPSLPYKTERHSSLKYTVRRRYERLVGIGVPLRVLGAAGSAGLRRG